MKLRAGMGATMVAVAVVGGGALGVGVRVARGGDGVGFGDWGMRGLGGRRRSRRRWWSGSDWRSWRWRCDSRSRW